MKTKKLYYILTKYISNIKTNTLKKVANKIQKEIEKEKALKDILYGLQTMYLIREKQTGKLLTRVGSFKKLNSKNITKFIVFDSETEAKLFMKSVYGTVADNVCEIISF